MAVMQSRSDIYKNLIDNMSDGILIIGFDGKIRLDNKNTAKILGLSEDSLCDKTVASLIMENPKNDDFFECIIDSIYTKEKINKTVIYYTDTGKKYLRLVVSFLKDKKEDTALVAIISDITELFELGQQNEALTEKLMEFLDDFVMVMIGAIDARSPYNANHTKNMVKYVDAYLDWLEDHGDDTHSRLRGPLIASVWLHDVGKLVIPLEIMDKPTRLGEHEDELFHRIEVAELNEKIKGYENPDYKAEAEKKIEELKKAGEFIASINGLGFINDEQRAELEHLSGMKCLNSEGEYINLLDDYDKESLAVERGTLTKEERDIISSHVVHTRNMLIQMHFEGPYEKVPVWASLHHELLDGSGYPDHLTAEDIPWESRLLTIVDVYDALTAEDRPYKPPMPTEKAFVILRNMASEGKIDGDILESFYESKAWS